MKPGDFVTVHLDDGCQVGRLYSDDVETVSVTLGLVTGEEIVMYGIPKKLVTLYLAL